MNESLGADHEILTLEEVAHYLRLKPQTIYKWAQERRIPAIKLGKEWRFRRSIVDRWLDEQMNGVDTSANKKSDAGSGAGEETGVGDLRMQRHDRRQPHPIDGTGGLIARPSALSPNR